MNEELEKKEEMEIRKKEIESLEKDIKCITREFECTKISKPKIFGYALNDNGYKHISSERLKLIISHIRMEQ